MRQRNQRSFRLPLGFPINVPSHFEVEGSTEGKAPSAPSVFVFKNGLKTRTNGQVRVWRRN